MNVMKETLLTILRKKNTSRSEFRWTSDRLTHLLACQAADHLATQTYSIESPMGATQGVKFSQNIVLVPILRSGITMFPPFLQYFPFAKIGVVGLKRDEQTAIAHWYYDNVPPIGTDDQVIVLDPMLATGGTLAETLSLLKKKGVAEKNILFVGIVSAPEGEQVIKEKFPEVTLLIAARDEKLNDKKFIVPGLGDFGDRYFGTE